MKTLMLLSMFATLACFFAAVVNFSIVCALAAVGAFCTVIVCASCSLNGVIDD